MILVPDANDFPCLNLERLGISNIAWYYLTSSLWLLLGSRSKYSF